jgi:hypothetical protein
MSLTAEQKAIAESVSDYAILGFQLFRQKLATRELGVSEVTASGIRFSAQFAQTCITKEISLKNSMESSPDTLSSS